MCKKVEYCIHLPLYLKFQGEIIEEHLDSYMYFRHITDRMAAIISFIDEYGWLMRECWCKKTCPEVCDIWEETIKFGHLKHKEL